MPASCTGYVDMLKYLQSIEKLEKVMLYADLFVIYFVLKEIIKFSFVSFISFLYKHDKVSSSFTLNAVQ